MPQKHTIVISAEQRELLRQALIDAGWKWRDRHGQFTRPADMETRHLFHTLRMIWNNTMPARMSVGAVRLYTFGPHYTRAYLADAVCALGNELFTRRDISPEQQAQLDEMARTLRSVSNILEGWQ